LPFAAHSPFVGLALKKIYSRAQPIIRRHPEISASVAIFSTGIFNNRLIVWGVVLEIALTLLISYTPWGNLLLGTAPVPAELWVFPIPFAAGMLVLEESRKWLVRRTLRDRAKFGELPAAS
jgi:hypothetical protein